MNSTGADLLVLGLGNVLLGDDGVGPAAVARLHDHHVIPDGVLCLDGGTLGLSLLPYLEDARMVVMVDAIAADAPAGTLVRLEGSAVGPAVATRLSPHQVGVADLLEGARWHDREPTRLVLLGIVPERIELGLGLSKSVLRTMPALVDLICAEAASLGHPFEVREDAAADTNFDVTRLFGGAVS